MLQGMKTLRALMKKLAPSAMPMERCRAFTVDGASCFGPGLQEGANAGPGIAGAAGVQGPDFFRLPAVFRTSFKFKAEGT
jgi:hypothetical protein